MDTEKLQKSTVSENFSGFFKEMYGTGAAENEKRQEHVLEEFGQAFGEKNVRQVYLRRPYRDQWETIRTITTERSWPEYQSGLRSSVAQQTEPTRSTLSVRHTTKISTININKFKAERQDGRDYRSDKRNAGRFPEMGRSIGGFDAHYEQRGISSRRGQLLRIL